MRIRVGFEFTYEFVRADPDGADAQRASVARDGSPSSPIRLRTYADAADDPLCRRVRQHLHAARRAGRAADHLHRFRSCDTGLPDFVPGGARSTPVEELPHEDTGRSCSAAAIARPTGSRISPGRCSARRRRAGRACRRSATTSMSHRLRLPERARPRAPPSNVQPSADGVCRDFAHLAVTLCRCMNIPARYCTGYLGDIGVPPEPDPMDFSAWFEVFLGGRWYTFDARHNRRASAAS